MKKGFVLGMVVVCGFQMAFAAGAARGVEGVRKAVADDVAHAKASGEFKPADANNIKSLSASLSKITGVNRDREMQLALSRNIEVKTVNGTEKVSLKEIGDKLVEADEFLRTQMTVLDPAGKKHLEATQNAIKVASEFLSLFSRTSDQGAVLTEVQKLEVEAIDKQVALIPDMLTKMDTADLISHTEVMKKAIAKKTSPNMNGDQALGAAMKEGKSQEEYVQYLKDLIGCV